MAQGKTILVVDDDPEIVTMLATRLARKQYRVVTATDGKEALTEAKRRHPDLIILDVMMPGKNGWEVARELKQDETTADIGIVVLTAIGEKINEMTSPLYGADEYIDKPFEFAKLEAAVEEVLKKRS